MLAESSHRREITSKECVPVMPNGNIDYLFIKKDQGTSHIRTDCAEGRGNADARIRAGGLPRIFKRSLKRIYYFQPCLSALHEKPTTNARLSRDQVSASQVTSKRRIIVVDPPTGSWKTRRGDCRGRASRCDDVSRSMAGRGKVQQRAAVRTSNRPGPARAGGCAPSRSRCHAPRGKRVAEIEASAYGQAGAKRRAH